MYLYLLIIFTHIIGACNLCETIFFHSSNVTEYIVFFLDTYISWIWIFPRHGHIRKITQLFENSRNFRRIHNRKQFQFFGKNFKTFWTRVQPHGRTSSATCLRVLDGVVCMNSGLLTCDQAERDEHGESFHVGRGMRTRVYATCPATKAGGGINNVR